LAALFKGIAEGAMDDDKASPAKLGDLIAGQNPQLFADVLSKLAFDSTSVSDALKPIVESALSRLDDRWSKLDQSIVVTGLGGDSEDTWVRFWTYARTAGLNLTDNDFWHKYSEDEVLSLLEAKMRRDLAGVQQTAPQKPVLTLGQKLRRLREVRGLVIEAVAADLGVSRDSVMDWEADRTTPGLKSKKALAEYFRIDIAELKR
jgi:DNA-binding XRE family transcriptional regulator